MMELLAMGGVVNVESSESGILPLLSCDETGADAEGGSEFRRRKERLKPVLPLLVASGVAIMVSSSDVLAMVIVGLDFCIVVGCIDCIEELRSCWFRPSRESLCSVMSSNHTFSGACKFRKVCTVSSRARMISKSPVPATCTTL